MTPPATKLLAELKAVPVFQPDRVRHAVHLVEELAPEIMIVMAYGQLLPQAILDIPSRGCLNLHASLLPRHRGAAPIQSAILFGEKVSGITVMYMDAGLDTGDILLRETLVLEPDDTGGSLHDRLAHLAPVALARALALMSNGRAPRVKQDHALATHLGKLERRHGVLDWNEKADAIARRVRAYDPWPGTTSVLDGVGGVKLFPPVEVVADFSGCPVPGTILEAGANGLLVACGEGALRFSRIQAEGRKRMSILAFIAGTSVIAGSRFDRLTHVV